MLVLHNYWRSSASYRVRIGLALKGLPFEAQAVHLVRGGGEQHSADYRRLNPEGRVPALVDDGRVLTQSLAILEYLEETHPEPALLPRDPAGRARVRSLAQVIACDIQPLQNTSTTLYLRDRLGLAPERIAEWLAHWIGRGLASLEAQLGRGGAPDGPYAHGDRPGLADCCIVPQLYAARRFGVDVAPYPRAVSIDAACGSLDAFQRAAPEVQPDAE